MPVTGWATLTKGPLVVARVPVAQVLSAHLSRGSLAGAEPFLVQAPLGRMVRLSCPGVASMDPPTRWQKDGQPLSSDRCVRIPLGWG